MSSSWLEQTLQTTNTYVLNAGSSTEQARLIDQEAWLTIWVGRKG